MKKRMLMMLGAVLVAVAVLAGWKTIKVRAAIQEGKSFAPPPTAVTTASVKKNLWQPALSAVGSLKAVNGVTVSSDLAGIVSQIAFQSGTEVAKGDLLVKLDTQQEEAQLRSAEARRDWAKVSLERQRDLAKTGAVSQAEFDSAESAFRQESAAVDNARAVIARKNIVAPFAGRLGLRQVDIGQYLEVGAPIVQLESVDPIYVEFAIPQQNLDQISAGQKIRLKAPGLGNEEFPGEITAVDSRLDPTTRNIRVQGTVHNIENKLRPGMFVNAEVLLPEREVISIPASAVAYAPYGDSVFVVKSQPAGKIVEQRFIKLGTARGDQLAVVSGLAEGDEVVSSGAFKLRNGLPVQINNSIQPSDDAHPNPPNT